MTVELSPDLLALFGRKSHSKKLFFSVLKGRRQVSMLLDSKEEAWPLWHEIGGTIGVKVRSQPKGALEWYYHDKGLMALCERILPLLNGFQQQYVSEWLEADRLAREPKLDL